MLPMIMTFTGRYVNPLDIVEHDIDIEDIAHALACCNRFAGHSRKPITVAQHSVYVSRLCDGDKTAALQGLLHDASEAYLGDVTKWVKATDAFAAYREAEEHVQRMVYDRFGCEKVMTASVELADKLMLRYEGLQAYGIRRWERWSSMIKYPMVTTQEKARIGHWQPWGWRQAEEAFLTQFRLVT